MDPFDTMKALGQMWGKGGEALLRAQGDAFGAMAKAAAGGDLSAFAAAAGPDAEALEKARAAYEKSWAAASEISASFAKSGRETGGADSKAGEILDKIFDPKGWSATVGGMDEGVARMVEGPRLADLWNMERKFAAVFSAWLALRRRALEHQTLMLDVWTRSAGRFAKTLNERTEGGEQLGSWRDMMPLWIEIANDQLIEAQRSEAFLASQREMLKASTDLKLAQQEVAAVYSDTFGYPTRAELDDVHRALTDLRREVRAARRARRPRKETAALGTGAQGTGRQGAGA